MNRNRKPIPLTRNGNGSDFESSCAKFFRFAIPALFMLLALAVAPAPRAAQTRLNIRITPRAAEMIAALKRGMTPTAASAGLPASSSNMIFAQSCKAAGSSAVVAHGTGFERLVCV